jgi:hypothetical protein
MSSLYFRSRVDTDKRGHFDSSIAFLPCQALYDFQVRSLECTPQTSVRAALSTVTLIGLNPMHVHADDVGGSIKLYHSRYVDIILAMSILVLIHP